MSTKEKYRLDRVKYTLPIAWCELHEEAVDLNRMRKKKCLAKGCWHFKKYESHPYWDERKKIKELKKKKKEEMKK